MKVVLDVNVFIAAALSGRGAPAQLIRAWHAGAFELVISPLLMAELKDVLEYPKLRHRILPEDSVELLHSLSMDATMLPDSGKPSSVLSQDEDDKYLIALAEQSGALLVSGDKDLLSLAEHMKVTTPAAFHDFLNEMGLI